jgi:hypothetical protein
MVGNKNQIAVKFENFSHQEIILQYLMFNQLSTFAIIYNLIFSYFQRT